MQFSSSVNRWWLAWLLVLAIACPADAVVFYTLLPPNGAGQTTFAPPRQINAAHVGVPAGYAIEPVAIGLTYPTAVVTDEEDTVYILEAGYSYGEDFTAPRLLRLEPDGQVVEIAVGANNGPWSGMSYHDGAFYVSEGGEVEGGRILRITRDGEMTTIVDGLPSMGDHHANRPIIGPDGYLYFGVGTATNSGVVGPDNADMGWLNRHPQHHDIPPVDIVLAGRNFTSVDRESGRRVTTGAFVPYGTPTHRGQVIEGQLPCNGAVLRVPISGGDMEWVAWGFRNPYSLAIGPDGCMYCTDNLYDERGCRPVYGAGDLLWKIKPGLWHGFPDFWGNKPLSHSRFEEKKGQRRPQFLLAEHPNCPPEPAARLAVRAGSGGMDFSSNPCFGHCGEAFVAIFGDITHSRDGKVRHPVGCRVVRVDTRTGVMQDFVVNKGHEAGPASKVGGCGIERPVDVRFNHDGSMLYVVDFGVMTTDACGQRPYRGTGVLWRVRPSHCGVDHSTYEPEGYYRSGEAIGRPVLINNERQLRGRAVYARHCYHCHQGGEGGLGPALLRLAPDPIVRLQIRAGLGQMPGFSLDEISHAEMNDLMAYLRTVRRSSGLVPKVHPTSVGRLGK